MEPQLIFASVISILVSLVLPVAIAGFGLWMPKIRGKVWLAVWASLLVVSNLWPLFYTLIQFAKRLDPEVNMMLNYGTIPIISLLSGIAQACLLLFVVSQCPGSLSGFGRILFSFRGRISRQQFWISTVALGFVNWTCCTAFFRAMANQNVYSAAKYSSLLGSAAKVQMIVAIVVYVIWTLASIWPSLAIQVKRWHDRGKSGWMVLVNLIPLVGPIWALIECGFLPGDAAANAYGENPLQPQPRQSWETADNIA